MDGILQDIRVGIRVLGKSPGATAVAVLALALGIGANTVTLSSVRSLVLYPLPFHDLDRIVRVWDTDPAHGFMQNMTHPTAALSGQVPDELEKLLKLG